MALDEATQALLGKMAQAERRPLWEITPAQARAQTAAGAVMYGQGPEVSVVHDDELVADDGGTFRVRTLVPEGDLCGLTVYFHGGGWVISSIDEFEPMARYLANASKSAIVLVDYRKAPEHPFPAPLEDGWRGFCWALDTVIERVGCPARIAVAGDSAGGNIAAVVARRARDQGVEVALQVLVYPVTSADFFTESYVAEENQLALTKRSMEWFWDQYLPDVTQRSNPSASPLLADDLLGVAPAFVITAEHDVLRDEGEAYAARLDEAGALLEHRVAVGQMHGFFQMVNVLPGSLEHVGLVADVLNKYLSADG